MLFRAVCSFFEVDGNFMMAQDRKPFRRKERALAVQVCADERVLVPK